MGNPVYIDTETQKPISNTTSSTSTSIYNRYGSSPSATRTIIDFEERIRHLINLHRASRESRASANANSNSGTSTSDSNATTSGNNNSSSGNSQMELVDINLTTNEGTNTDSVTVSAPRRYASGNRTSFLETARRILSDSNTDTATTSSTLNTNSTPSFSVTNSNTPSLANGTSLIASRGVSTTAADNGTTTRLSDRMRLRRREEREREWEQLLLERDAQRRMDRDRIQREREATRGNSIWYHDLDDDPIDDDLDVPGISWGGRGYGFSRDRERDRDRERSNSGSGSGNRRATIFSFANSALTASIPAASAPESSVVTGGTLSTEPVASISEIQPVTDNNRRVPHSVSANTRNRNPPPYPFGNPTSYSSSTNTAPNRPNRRLIRGNRPSTTVSIEDLDPSSPPFIPQLSSSSPTSDTSTINTSQVPRNTGNDNPVTTSSRSYAVSSLSSVISSYRNRNAGFSSNIRSGSGNSEIGNTTTPELPVTASTGYLSPSSMTQTSDGDSMSIDLNALD
ncbi:hypothetical protein BKA69DRAFT_1168013 [Paraphysoderma sedebokerense]|nr:hypothetical protein BKA69DRAFT_1168013 [Paraphysoderma sedebokerense]